MDLREQMKKSEKSGKKDSKLDFKQIGSYIQYALWGLAYFEQLGVERIILSDDYVASILYDGEHYLLHFPKLEAVFDVQSQDNKIELNIKKLHIIEPNMEVAGRILYASSSGQIGFGLAISPFLSSANAESKKLDSRDSGVDSSADSSAKNAESKSQDLKNSGIKIFLQGTSDLKRLVLKAQTSKIKNLDFLRESLAQSAPNVLPALDKWLFDALSFDTMEIKTASFDITLNDKKFFKTLMENAKMTLLVSKPNYKLDPSLQPFAAKSAQIKVANMQAVLEPDDIKFDTTSLAGSRLIFTLPKDVPTLSIQARAEQLDYTQALRDLLAIYHVKIPLDSIDAQTKAKLDINVAFEEEAHVSLKGEINAQDGLISISGQNFSTKQANIAINITPQIQDSYVDIWTQNTRYENLFDIDTKSRLSLADKKIKTSLFIHALRVSTNPDVNQRLIQPKEIFRHIDGLDKMQDEISNEIQDIQESRERESRENDFAPDSSEDSSGAESSGQNMDSGGASAGGASGAESSAKSDSRAKHLAKSSAHLTSALRAFEYPFGSFTRVPIRNFAHYASNTTALPESKSDSNPESQNAESKSSDSSDNDGSDGYVKLDSNPNTKPAAPNAPAINTPTTNTPSTPTAPSTTNASAPNNPQDSIILPKAPDASQAPQEEILEFGEDVEQSSIHNPTAPINPATQEPQEAESNMSESSAQANPDSSAESATQKGAPNDTQENAPATQENPESSAPDSAAQEIAPTQEQSQTQESAQNQEAIKNDEGDTSEAGDTNNANNTSETSNANNTSDTNEASDNDAQPAAKPKKQAPSTYRTNGVELDFTKPMSPEVMQAKIIELIKHQDEQKFTYDIFSATQESLPQIDIEVDFAQDPVLISIPTLDVQAQVLGEEIKANITNFAKFAPYSPLMRYLGLSQGSAFVHIRGAKDFSFGVSIIDFPSFLLDKQKQVIKDFSFRGIYANDKLQIKSEDELIGLDLYDNTVLASFKDIDVDIDSLLSSEIPAIQEAFSTSSEKKAVFTREQILLESEFLRQKRRYERQNNIKPKIIAIEAENVVGFFKDITLPFDDFNAKIRDDRISADATYKNGIANIDIIHGNVLFKAGNFSGDFLNRVIGRKIVDGGLFEMGGIYKEEIFNGEISMQNTSFVGFAIAQNIIGLIDTIPSLVMFRSPALSSKGYEVSKGKIKVSLNTQYVGLESIDLTGKSMDIVGNGFIEIDTQEVDMGLSISTLKNLSGILNKIPIVGYLLLGKDGRVTTQVSVRGTLQDPKTQISLAQDLLKTPLKVIQRAFAPVDMVIDEIIKSVDR